MEGKIVFEAAPTNNLTLDAKSVVEFTVAIDATKIVGAEGAKMTLTAGASTITTSDTDANGVFVHFDGDSTYSVVDAANKAASNTEYTYKLKANIGGGSEITTATGAWLATVTA